MPRVVVTDKLRSYGAAHREVRPSVEHRSHKGMNNRAENSPYRPGQRERAMKGFRSTGRGAEIPRRVQRDLTPLPTPPPQPVRYPLPATRYRAEMIIRFAIWDYITGIAGPPATA